MEMILSWKKLLKLMMEIMMSIPEDIHMTSNTFVQQPLPPLFFTVKNSTQLLKLSLK